MLRQKKKKKKERNTDELMWIYNGANYIIKSEHETVSLDNIIFVIYFGKQFLKHHTVSIAHLLLYFFFFLYQTIII